MPSQPPRFTGLPAVLSPRRVNPRDGLNYFFGYYDVPAFDHTGGRHLCHRTTFRDRLPTPADRVELGSFDLADGSFTVHATSGAWNFQQGAMLQWLPTELDTIIYNDLAKAGGYRAVIHNIASGATRDLPQPVAAVSANGLHALSLNFNRLHDFRPGYGYAATPDSARNIQHPIDDGIWLIDMAAGTSRLLLSYAQLFDQLTHLHTSLSRKLLVNHITFNPSGNRFVALVRNFPDKSTGGTWCTTVITADLNGENLHVLVPASYASHYHWQGDDVLVIHADGPDGMQLYTITDSPVPNYRAIDPGFFFRDGHCSHSPDRRWMLYDSYPDEAGLQHLFLYDLETREGTKLGAFAAQPVPLIDLRCDLHPRWSPDGRTVSIDSTHDHDRSLFTLPLFG